MSRAAVAKTFQLVGAPEHDWDELFDADRADELAELMSEYIKMTSEGARLLIHHLGSHEHGGGRPVSVHTLMHATGHAFGRRKAFPRGGWSLSSILGAVGRGAAKYGKKAAAAVVKHAPTVARAAAKHGTAAAKHLYANRHEILEGAKTFAPIASELAGRAGLGRVAKFAGTVGRGAETLSDLISGRVPEVSDTVASEDFANSEEPFHMDLTDSGGSRRRRGGFRR